MPSPVNDPLLDHSLELLSAVGPPRSRRMFGGHGLYVDDLFVAIIAFDRLYLKADETTRPLFEAAGCQPFTYEAKGQRVSLGYWTAPDEAMDSPAAMAPWARLALQAALRAKAAAPVKRPRARRESASAAATAPTRATRPAAKKRPAAGAKKA